jgi:putative oxidoreductase
MKTLAKIWNQFELAGTRLPEDIVILVSRVAICSVFWRSVQTKITGWEVYGQSLQFFNISASTVMLFQYEYQLPVLSPTVAAYAGTFAEFFFSLMLLFGLGTRLAALGLLSVTAVIQLMVFPEAWPTHIVWLAILLYLLKRGGGRFSVDYILRRKLA